LQQTPASGAIFFCGNPRIVRIQYCRAQGKIFSFSSGIAFTAKTRYALAAQNDEHPAEI
jgi:hypothetical protein